MERNTEYFPIKLKKAYPLDDLPTDAVMIKACGE
jgi:hypothetical protein